MDIFKLSGKLLVILIVGSLVSSFYLVLHSVPLGDIERNIGEVLFIGMLTILFSEPIHGILKPWLKGISESISVILGTATITFLLYLFPVGVPEYKFIQMDGSVSTQNINELRKEALEKGKDIFFIEREGFYLLIDKKDPKSLPYIPSGIVKQTYYGLYEINFDGKKFLVVKDLKTEERKMFMFLASVFFVYILLSLVRFFVSHKIDKKTQRNYPSTRRARSLTAKASSL